MAANSDELDKSMSRARKEVARLGREKSAQAPRLSRRLLEQAVMALVLRKSAPRRRDGYETAVGRAVVTLAGRAVKGGLDRWGPVGFGVRLLAGAFGLWAAAVVMTLAAASLSAPGLAFVAGIGLLVVAVNRPAVTAKVLHALSPVRALRRIKERKQSENAETPSPAVDVATPETPADEAQAPGTDTPEHDVPEAEAPTQEMPAVTLKPGTELTRDGRVIPTKEAWAAMRAQRAEIARTRFWAEQGREAQFYRNVMEQIARGTSLEMVSIQACAALLQYRTSAPRCKENKAYRAALTRIGGLDATRTSHDIVLDRVKQIANECLEIYRDYGVADTRNAPGRASNEVFARRARASSSVYGASDASEIAQAAAPAPAQKSWFAGLVD